MTILCAGEAEEFPEEQFQHDPHGVLVQPYIHLRGDPHWASNGEPLAPSTIPGTYGIRAEVGQLVEIANQLSPETLRQLVDTAHEFAQGEQP